ncbi:MAG: hypothetical protein ACT4P6_22410 [Gemmatimonadaceae bacterium]
MKKLTFLAAAVLVALGTSAANAQDTTRKESKGDVMKAPPTTASIVTVIDGSLVVASKIGGLKIETPPKVEFVDVRTVALTESDQEIVKTALEKNKDAIKQLQDELKKRDALVTAISTHDQKPEPGDVIGAEIGEGDKLVIYFWKK